MHDFDFDQHSDHGPEESGSHGNPDLMELLSVGIDIGSSTSHLMLSRLFLQRRSLELSSRFEVVKREVIYRSNVLLTPYQDRDTINTEALSRFIAQSYAEAEVGSSQVDTGAVICTGEASKKKNAEAIVRLFANQGGKFVCATAGHNFEAALAAYGSGAVARACNATVMNVDIGGGTSKMAIVKNGEILETAAINIGSRLVAWDAQGRVSRIEEAGARIARRAGVSLEHGKQISRQDKVALAETMAELLFEFIEGRGLSSVAEELLLTPYSGYSGDGAQILFSGGVSEYIYGREVRDYGDLGPFLSGSIRSRLPRLRLEVGEPAERLRATVIGASQYTIQVSSSTIFLSREGLLPVSELLVVTPLLEGTEPVSDVVVRSIEKAFTRFDLVEQPRPAAIFIRYPWGNSYHALKTLALGVLQAEAMLRHQNPLVLIFDADIAKLVGNILKEELGLKKDLVVIDEIEVGDLDFIDIGEELGRTLAVPVVVKSLVFSRNLHQGHESLQP